MTGLDLFKGDQPASLRQPVHKISFGSSEGGAGGFLSVLDAGGPDPWQQNLVSVTVQVGPAPHVDIASISLSGGDRAPSVAIDDEGSIALGYEDSSTDVVFTARVDGVKRSVGGTVLVTAVNGSAALSRLRINQSYEKQTAGDIVSELAGIAGIGTATIEDGVDLPFYVIDDRRSAYQHVATLARKSGFLAYVNPEGDLSFKPFVAGQPVGTFTYGVDIISLQVLDAAPVTEAVTTIGDGAAGSQGQDAWSWLIKDPSPVKGSAGDGGSERTVQDASLRSSDAAQSCAESIAEAACRMKLTGRMLVPGAPVVVVGSVIETKDAPDDTLNGLSMVRRVCHHFSKSDGFTTLIEFCKTGDGGGGGTGGIGGLL